MKTERRANEMDRNSVGEFQGTVDFLYSEGRQHHFDNGPTDLSRKPLEIKVVFTYTAKGELVRRRSILVKNCSIGLTFWSCAEKVLLEQLKKAKCSNHRIQT